MFAPVVCDVCHVVLCMHRMRCMQCVWSCCMFVVRGAFGFFVFVVFSFLVSYGMRVVFMLYAWTRFYVVLYILCIHADYR